MAVSVSEEGRQLSATATASLLTTARSYTAFGEVAAETDALGAVTGYAYNTMGRRIRTDSAAVSVTDEHGTATTAPLHDVDYYDRSGRHVASRDANGHLTRQTLLAGTGYGSGAALVTADIHADGGTVTTGYDVHGDARVVTDELGHRTLQSFDKMGRLTARQQVRAEGVTTDDLTDYYSYDGLGQQLKHWTSQDGATYADITNYDYQGRITGQTDMAGHISELSYTLI